MILIITLNNPHHTLNMRPGLFLQLKIDYKTKKNAMKIFQSKYLWVITSFVLFTGYWVSCTKDNQVIETPTPTNGTELFSNLTTTAPVIDGTVDAVWENAPKLSFTGVVPDPGNNLFTGFIGEEYPATIRSLYDAENIYFLAEWDDAQQSTNIAPWYFDTTLNVTGKTGWQREPTNKSFDANGNLVRTCYGEDKLAMLWNINNSTAKFGSQTCYSSCHVFTPYLDYANVVGYSPNGTATAPVTNSNQSNGNHYTNGANEKIDMWWGRLGYIGKDATTHLMDDNYQDWAGGPTYTNVTGGSGNGRHVDGIAPNGTSSTTWPYRPNYSTSPAQGEVANTQSLKLDGTGASVTVPLWVVPGVQKGLFITVADTAGAAKKVTAVSSAGVLTLSDGSTINPYSGTDYQRTGNAVTGPTAKISIPGNIAVPLKGGRADITCSAVYTGTGWIVEYKRALKTSDTASQDVDFSSLEDQMFGIAIFNQDNYQHGIKTNLVLKFNK